MQGKVIGTNNVNIRDVNGNVATITTSLKPGDIVYGSVAGSWPKIYFSKIYRKAGNVENLDPSAVGKLFNAVTRAESGTPVYMELNDVPEPGTEHTPTGTVVPESLKVSDVVNGVEQPFIYYDKRT